MVEAVGILRTGSEQILNSKSVYSRCKLPGIVANDGKEEVTLGDTEEDAKFNNFLECKDLFMIKQ